MLNATTTEVDLGSEFVVLGDNCDRHITIICCTRYTEARSRNSTHLHIAHCVLKFIDIFPMFFTALNQFFISENDENAGRIGN